MVNETQSTQALKTAIGKVANQYQCAALMRCWIRFGCFTLVLVAIGMAVLKAMETLAVPRLLPIPAFLLVEAIAFGFLVIRPLRRPVTRSRIALYIEEKHPELENRLISAVDFESRKTGDTSSWMIDQFFQDTDRFVKRISFSDLLDTDLLIKMLLISLGFFVLSGLIVALGYPLWIPNLSSLHRETPAASPAYEFTVEPGNARVRIGDNQAILCKTTEDKKTVSLYWRSTDSQWNSESMQLSLTGGVYSHTFSSIQNNIQYRVQIGETSSDTFTLKAWTPPRVESIDVVYRFPDYLGREPQETPNVESIAVVEGTRIDLTARVNKKLHSAEMIFDSSETLALRENGDSSWTLSWIPAQNGRFSLLLTDGEGAKSEFNPQHDIVLQIDKPPVITLDFPRQDIEAGMLDEIPFEFRVTDDFGVSEFGIQYEIAGRDRVAVPLQGDRKTGQEAKASHALYLEDMKVQPGDLITWTAWAKDLKPNRDEYETLGDPFFIEIRPFRRSYENAISNAGAGQSQQGEGQNGGRDAASQKEIVIATWNLRREAPSLNDEEFSRKRDAVIAAQKQLLEKYKNPETPMPVDSPILPQLLDAMRMAVQSLESAGKPDPSKSLAQALADEQKAYRLILKLRPDKTQVQQQMARGERGNSGENSPDIGELEIERKRNFYEEERQTQQQMKKTDEALGGIADLTRRQKSINEEISKLISETKKETTPEELKRQLERLQEEERRNLERLDEMKSALAMSDRRDSNADEALRRLGDVRQQMNRGLEQMRNEQLQEARASGSRAVNALDRMQEEVQQISREGAAQRMSALQEKMNDLIAKEKSIRDRLESLKKEQETPSLALDTNSDEKKIALLDEKTRLADDFKNTLSLANEIAERSRRSQGLLSQKLGDWMRQTSGLGIYEDILNERRTPLIQYGIWDSALEREKQILNKLQESANELNTIADSQVSSDLEGMQLALDRLKELIQPGNSDSSRASATQPAGDAVNDASAIASSDATSNPQSNESNSIPGESEASVLNPAAENTSPTGSTRGQSAPGAVSSTTSELQVASDEIRDATGAASRPQASRSGGAGDSGGGTRWPGREEIRSPQSMRRFAESDYRQWMDSLRNAEQLLPGENPSRERIARIRQAIEEMRLDFHRDRQPPQYELFLKSVADPLLETARELDKKIQSLLSQDEFVLLDEGGVPDRYRDQVADYFKKVSEIRTPK